MDSRLRLKSFEISQNLCQKTQGSSVTDNIDRLYRCWWRMFETECVGDNFGILMSHQFDDRFNSREKTVHSMNGLVLNASESTDTQRKSRQYNDSVTDILNLTPTWRCHQHQCSRFVFTRPFMFNLRNYFRCCSKPQ